MIIFYIIHKYNAKTEDERTKNLESVHEIAETLAAAAYKRGIPCAVVPWWSGLDPSRPDTGRARSRGLQWCRDALMSIPKTAPTAALVAVVCGDVAQASAGMRHDMHDAIRYGWTLFSLDAILEGFDLLGGGQ